MKPSFKVANTGWNGSKGCKVVIQRYIIKEAEKFAKEDKEKRVAIDTKNQADSAVYQAEKQLKELGEKFPTPVRETIEAKAQKP